MFAYENFFLSLKFSHRVFIIKKRRKVIHRSDNQELKGYTFKKYFIGHYTTFVKKTILKKSENILFYEYSQ